MPSLVPKKFKGLAGGGRIGSAHVDLREVANSGSTSSGSGGLSRGDSSGASSSGLIGSLPGLVSFFTGGGRR